MKRLSLILLPCLLVVALAGLFLRPTFAHGATASPINENGWSVVRSPNAGGINAFNTLAGAAAISANDVWAVGSYFVQGPNRGHTHALTEHWNGMAWSIVPDASPVNYKDNSSLNGVAAVATNDVWAVGWAKDNSTYTALTEHWNGTKWSIVPSPKPGSGYPPTLYGVAAISANDVWAIGDYLNSDKQSQHTVIENWNGTAWRIVPGPSPVGLNSFRGITAVSATDVWASGSVLGVSTRGIIDQSFIEHWNGTNWTIVATPTGNRDASGLAAVSATNIWAVGYTYGGIPSYKSKILIEHWNGTRWTVVPSPNVQGILFAVSAMSRNDAWAVGAITYKDNNIPLIVHWNGTEWSIVSSPKLQSFANELSGVAQVPGTTRFWATGRASFKTLTEFHP